MNRKKDQKVSLEKNARKLDLTKGDALLSAVWTRGHKGIIKKKQGLLMK